MSDFGSYLRVQGSRLGILRSGKRSVRLLSLLTLGLLASALFVWPALARAGNTSPAAAVPADATVNVVVIGDFYSYGYSTSTSAGLRHSVPPTLQALNQIQAANPRVKINVLFIPVADATGGALNRTVATATTARQSRLIDAVRSASIVIDGLAVGNARFADWMRTILFRAGASAKTLPQLMTVFDDGAYLQAQTKLLGTIAKRMAPGSSIVTLGYPEVVPGRSRSGGVTWGSPYAGHDISQQQASMSDQLVSALNTANRQATSITGAKQPGLHFLYADMSGVLSQAAGARSSQPDSAAQTMVGNGLLPYLDQAVNDVLTAKGIQGAATVQPASATSRWYLSVQIPPATQPPATARTPKSASAPASAARPVTSNARVNTPPTVMPVPSRLCTIRPTAGRPGGTAGCRVPACGMVTAGCRVPACAVRCPVISRGGLPVRRMVSALGFPAPPGPTPRQVSPQHPPTPGGGAGSNPAGNASSNPGQSSGAGSGSQSGRGTTSAGGGTSSGGGTTSSGSGFTSSGSGSSFSGSASSGSGSSFSGSSASGGSSSGGGSFS